MAFDPVDIERAERIKRLLKPIFELFVHVSSSGTGNFPRNRPCLLISNHRSDMDPWVLSATAPRHICWIADYYLFEIPLIGKLMEEMSSIPISEKKSDIVRAFRKSKEAFLANQVVGIFPEGHDTITGSLQDLELGRFHTGFAEFAVRLGVDIVPAVIVSRKEKFDPIPVPKAFRKLFNLPEDVVNTEKRLVYENVHVHYGMPVSISDYKAKAEDPDGFDEAVLKLTEDMHAKMLAMIRDHAL